MRRVRPRFHPLMTAYLTDDTSPTRSNAVCRRRVGRGQALPRGATTTARRECRCKQHPRRARRMRRSEWCCASMARHRPDCRCVRPGSVFIERVLSGVPDFPTLKIVFEHITTRDAVAFVEQSGANVAATVTPHHLIINRNAIFADGLRPHFYCLPVAKREEHRLAVRRAAISGNSKFFLGTDSAPHARHAKESACGCAGIFNAPYASKAMRRCSTRKARWTSSRASRPSMRALLRSAAQRRTVTLEKREIGVPDELSAGDPIVPFLAGETIGWSIAD